MSRKMIMIPADEFNDMITMVRQTLAEQKDMIKRYLDESNEAIS